MELQQTPFYFLRHGETEWNRSGLIQGRRDIPLNARGIAEARSARDLLQGAGIATICTSPLQRALLTAEIIAAGLHLPLHIVPELAECDFGRAEGRRKGLWLEHWRRGSPAEDSEAGDRPDGETYIAFLERALIGVNKALTRPGPVLIVAHGGIYEAVERQTGIFAGAGFGLPNALPIRHDPPAAPLLPWRVQPCPGPISAAASSVAWRRSFSAERAAPAAE